MEAFLRRTSKCFFFRLILGGRGGGAGGSGCQFFFFFGRPCTTRRFCFSLFFCFWSAACDGSANYLRTHMESTEKLCRSAAGTAYCHVHVVNGIIPTNKRASPLPAIRQPPRHRPLSRQYLYGLVCRKLLVRTYQVQTDHTNHRILTLFLRTFCDGSTKMTQATRTCALGSFLFSRGFHLFSAPSCVSYTSYSTLFVYVVFIREISLLSQLVEFTSPSVVIMLLLFIIK